MSKPHQGHVAPSIDNAELQLRFDVISYPVVTVATPKANGRSSCRATVYLSFAEGAQCIYLEPFVYAFFVEEVGARKLSEIIIVRVSC
jgi:hypothetical protein